MTGFEPGSSSIGSDRAVPQPLPEINKNCYTTLPDLTKSKGGPRLPLLFTSYSYRHLEGHFLAEMAGKLNRLEWQGKKISLKDTSR